MLVILKGEIFNVFINSVWLNVKDESESKQEPLSSLMCNILLLPSRKILNGINRPAGNFADICADNRNVAQQEEGGKG